MSEDVEDDIVALIKNHKSLERLNIDWYGGEPLMAFDVMQSLTKKIQDLNLPDFKSSIVTNGYLLNEAKCKELKSMGVYRIQITMDGLEDTHNVRRPHKTNKDSFSKIVENIGTLFRVYPEISVHIRVNIDKDNSEDFFKLNDYLKNKINTSNLMVYPAFITEFNPCKASFCMLDRMEQAEFAIKNKDKYPFGLFYYPQTKVGECIARFMNSYIIGPKGELYKCWCDVGEDSKVTGTLKNGVTNVAMYTRYMSESDPLFDENCLKCSYFPICNGGCAFRRLKKLDGYNDDLCTIQKDKMESFIKMLYYQQSQQINKSIDQ
jgi:uncharacterized protein